MGIFSVGFLAFTLMVKIATPIMLGEFRATPEQAPPTETSVPPDLRRLPVS